MLSINLHASDPTLLSLLGSMYIDPVSPFPSSILNLAPCSAKCLAFLPAFSDTLNSPTIPLFDWFYCPMHAVTVTMRRNDLLARHVTLTQRHTIPPYPLASLTTNQCNGCI